ncbi:UvrD-helicase domain-containing protein [Enemella sp. A6]|uniref:UvrD-helicase domain-containing protein n=1 Tax=Enemella sp. A6 TaxID=3440152 RepID=UPI003EB8F5DC
MSKAFDLAGELPAPGTRVLLEASAGTGKTFAIVTLAVRYLAAGLVELPQLLLITFTEAATGDLRSRLRERLADTAEALTTDRPAGDDPILKAIDRDGDRGAALHRIRAALSEYDRATIRTTHAFCAAMLTELGMLADHDVSQILTKDVDSFIHEIGVDCWLRRFGKQPSPSLPLSVRKRQERDGLKIAQLVATNPGSELWPPRDFPDLHEAARDQVEFAHDVREEFELRKRRLRVQTFDDLQNRLRDALGHPTTGALVAERLQQRFPLVMVDEFQDTDPVQWQVLRRAFDGRSTMVLIGDPKQAIYGFRGADVQSYLDARAGAEVFTLDRNWRTDRPVQRCLDALFGQAALGEGIAVTPVDSHQNGRLFHTNGAAAAPMNVRLIEGTFDDYWQARPAIAEHAASHIAETLTDPPIVHPKDGDPRPVRPGDMAVLVRTIAMGEFVRDALRRRGVPVVFPGAKGVFSSPAAQYWETLLAALDSPRAPQVRGLALTPLIGWSLQDLAASDEADHAELMQQVRQWARVLATDGVSALFDSLSVDRDVTGRLLGTEDGERLVTDLRHLAQVLHQAQGAENLGTAGLLAWLRKQRALLRGSDEEPRRLETDSDVVFISTMHGAKGLEYPLVFLPDTWDHIPPLDLLPSYHDREDGRFKRMLDVVFPYGAVSQQHGQLAEAEQFDEDLRLFYVATTRAQHQLTLWWADVRNRTKCSPLHRMLYTPRVPGQVPATEVTQPIEPHPDGLPHLSRAGAVVSYSKITDTVLPPPRVENATNLRARVFTREIDRAWRRTSYSGLTAQVHALGPNVLSEPPVSGTEDEPETLELVDEATPVGSGMLSPMSHLPAGTRFGTLVHAVLEEVDFRAPDLAAEVHRHSARLLARLPVAGIDATGLTEALLPSLLTPLGPLAGGRRLADIATIDRLPELDFDYPLAGGDSPAGRVRLGDLASLMADRLPPDDPLIDYPEMLSDPMLADEPLRGFLTGSIDAVFRFTDREAARYVVSDYKTNRLGAPGVDLLVDNYHPKRLAEAMMSSHYPLQALLYQVALHRYLRWRQPRYRPEEHLGGVLYLFVRGMAGPETPVVDDVPHGVFSWRPPAGLVCDLSDLIAGGARWAS